MVNVFNKSMITCIFCDLKTLLQLKTQVVFQVPFWRPRN